MTQDLCTLLREKKLISIVRGAPTEKITKIADALWRGGFGGADPHGAGGV